MTLHFSYFWFTCHATKIMPEVTTEVCFGETYSCDCSSNSPRQWNSKHGAVQALRQSSTQNDFSGAILHFSEESSCKNVVTISSAGLWYPGLYILLWDDLWRCCLSMTSGPCESAWKSHGQAVAATEHTMAATPNSATHHILMLSTRSETRGTENSRGAPQKDFFPFSLWQCCFSGLRLYFWIELWHLLGENDQTNCFLLFCLLRLTHSKIH